VLEQRIDLKAGDERQPFSFLVPRSRAPSDRGERQKPDKKKPAEVAG
jgi:hypothetical protein